VRSRDNINCEGGNDGTVSVASETAPEAVRDAAKVQGFNEDQVSILSNAEVFRHVEMHLDD
jgi:hypothetical protein